MDSAAIPHELFMGDCIGTEGVDYALDREVLGQPRLWVFIR